MRQQTVARTPLNWVTVALIILISSCSADDMNVETPPQSVGRGAALTTEQSAAVADGNVTQVEYSEAFRRFSSCVGSVGYDVERLANRGKLIEYRMLEEAWSTAEVKKCYDSEFSVVDEMWQIANEDSSESNAHLRQCLRRWNLSDQGLTDILVERLKHHKLDAITCKSIAD